MSRRGRPLIERLMERIDQSGDCWRWTGYIHPTIGYGMFTVKSIGTRPAHRWVYEELIGPIPAGLEIDHLCRNRACVNPAHLEAVTHAENVRRGEAPDATRQRALARQTCINGHPWTPENTGPAPVGRRCRACARENSRKWGRAHPEAVAERNRRWREKQKGSAA